jgi:starch synthase
MKRSKIFFISAEIYPFVKSTRAGEFAGSLPSYLQAEGHEVRVMMPKYSLINERKYIIRDIIRLKDIPVTMPGGTIHVSVKSGFLPESKTQIYFADYDKFFKRTDLYRDKRTGQFFKDNDLRFIGLARTAIATLRQLGWQPDIIHCCDWPTGALPALIRQEQSKDNFFKKTIVVFSVNMMDEAGLHDKAAFNLAMLSEKAVDKEKTMHKNKFSFLKAGVSFSDAVTVPYLYKHLKSIPKPKNDFEQILSSVKAIVDLPIGGDYNLWNPASNNSLHKPYSVEKYERRKVNREKFMEDRRTGFAPDRPVIGVLADDLHVQQKDVLQFLKTLKSVPLQLFVLSDVNTVSIGALKNALGKNSNHIVYALHDPEDQMRHYFYTMCDALFIPSGSDLAEVSYLNGLHYGVLPIIHKSCSVADLFTPVKGSKGTAFLYDQEKDLVKRIDEINALFAQAEAWQELALNAMKTDLSWARFTSPLIKVYERAFSKLK